MYYINILPKLSIYYVLGWCNILCDTNDFIKLNTLIWHNIKFSYIPWCFEKIKCSPSWILRFSYSWIYRKIKQTPQFSQELEIFRNYSKFCADFWFGMRSVTSNATRIQSKNDCFSVWKSLCPIYKSYIGPTNWKRNESVLLVWATRRRTFICSVRCCAEFCTLPDYAPPRSCCLIA